MSIEEASTGLASPVPRRTTPYSVSMPHTLGTATPKAYRRRGGVPACPNRLPRPLRTVSDGGPVCVTVTLVDAVVLARSQFHTSMNYRSVVVVGRARLIEDVDEKRRAMTCLVDHVAPGRSAEARPPTDAELRLI